MNLEEQLQKISEKKYELSKSDIIVKLYEVSRKTVQIEGKIEGQVIVILTKYVRKQNSW